MPVLRTDIERALDDLASYEEGMRFQGLAVALGKKRWPELKACQRKKDLGLDAYAPASLTPEKIGKGLAASITPKLKKISDDAKTAKNNFPDLKTILFVTAGKVGNTVHKKWEEAIQKDHGLELHIIEREEIITLMLMPENASLCASHLHMHVNAEPQVADLIDKTRRAADAATRTWARKTKGHPLIELTAVRCDPNGAESSDVLSLEQIDRALSEGRRLVLEGPAGRGKTTTLIQLAQRTRAAGTAFMVELPAWVSSRKGILEFIAGMPAFQAEGLTATDLARVQQTEPFLLLLNGWNEIAESNSVQANDSLRELERDFPSAGIIVATRTHHLAPPLPGSLRLRLLHLRRMQRAAYLTARLGAKGTELLAHIDADSSLGELTRTPFILSEVASLFEAGAEIPTTKIGILDQVIRLQEQRDEHRNALQSAPIFGGQTEYLEALATEMTRYGGVAMREADARSVVAAVARELAHRGQIEPEAAPAVLAGLTAHHLLERVDYPQTSFQFEHQQIQEYYAALGVRARLFDLRDNDRDATGRFTADYVNDPAWSEPLRMIAETFAGQTGNGESDRRNTSAGGRLVAMALDVDLVFAGELAQLCGAAVWDVVRGEVSDRFRAVYGSRDGNFRQCALAAMLATGADDFTDIIVPFLSEQDRQARRRTYRLWPDFHVSSIGPNWRDQLRGWSEEAREDFVSEILHLRVSDEVVAFAVEDNGVAVKKAAVSGLMCTRSEDALTRVLESMDTETFEEVARENADRMPTALKPETIAAMRKFFERTTDQFARLRTILDLIRLGESVPDSVVKEVMMALSSAEKQKLSSHYLHRVFDHLRETDPAWVSEWVAIQIAEGIFYEREHWLPFATPIPDGLVEKYLRHLETKDFQNTRIEGMIEVIAARADAKLAARVFTTLRELRRKVDAEPDQRHEFERQVMRQLEALFRGLPDDIAGAGVLLSVTRGDPLDIKVAADLISKVGRSDLEPLHIADDDLRARLRAYLKSSVDLVLQQDDFNGEEKANLASSIAQVGKPEDMVDLLTLIRADFERMRRGRKSSRMSYAGWHIAAVIALDPVGAEQVLIDLLPEPEYLRDVTAAMSRDFVPRSGRPFGDTFRYDLMWAARSGRAAPAGDDRRRARFAVALNGQIRRLREQLPDGQAVANLKQVAMALAAVDGRGSAEAVVEVIAMPSQWDHYVRLDAAERLLMAGVVLSATTAFALADFILERMAKWMQNSDAYLLRRALALCPFVDDCTAGIAKIRDVLGKQRLRGYELRELVTALGESRSVAAVDLLEELAFDALTFEQCEENFLNAFSTLDTQRTRELLLSIVDPNTCGIALTRRPHNEDVLISRLAELAQRRPEVGVRLWELCERDLPDLNRNLLSMVIDRLGTQEALAANLNLIDDTEPTPVPQGIRNQLEAAFVDRRRHGQSPNVFALHARASNELRVRLFRMATEDQKRRKSALGLLGQIELWRLEYGRPAGEPRHPYLASGLSWPINEVVRVPKESSVPHRIQAPAGKVEGKG